MSPVRMLKKLVLALVTNQALTQQLLLEAMQRRFQFRVMASLMLQIQLQTKYCVRAVAM
jgi:hypothetical protein